MPARNQRLPHPRVAVLLAVLFAIAAVQAVLPITALGAVTLTASCDGVSVRTKASTTAPVKVHLKAGARIVATARLNGGSWSTKCAGHSASGKTWFRISTINGKRVSSLYGVTYVYAATSLFKAVVAPLTLSTACAGVTLRKGASTTSAAVAKLPAAATVVASTRVSGGAWSASCAGGTVKGTAWWRIISVNGKSTASLYGVSAVYGASSLFAAGAAPASKPSPTPAPTPKPSPSPTPKPSATPAPTPAPSPTPKPSATPAPTPTPTPSPSYVEGLDVSHWQGTIAWPAVAGTGRDFAFIKASDDVDYVDPNYATNYAQAKAAGLVVGGYHFARPDAAVGDAVAEADHFADTLRIAKGDLRPVLDLETNGGLSVTALQAWVQAFLEEVHVRTGLRGLIYVSPSFWSSSMGGSRWFADNGYTLWVAHWTTAAQPTVPGSGWGGDGWTFWQFTSNGTVAGISGRVDLDRYHDAGLGPVQVP